MSRRFGRQQKRKLQARMEAAERSAAAARTHAEENAAILRRTAAVLGSDLISLPPAEVTLQSPDPFAVGQIKRMKHHLAQCAPFTPEVQIRDAVAEIVHYYDILQCADVFIDTSKAVHIRVRYGDWQFGYAFDQRVLAEPGMGPLVEQIAMELSYLIKRQAENTLKLEWES